MILSSSADQNKHLHGSLEDLFEVATQSLNHFIFTWTSSSTHWRSPHHRVSLDYQGRGKKERGGHPSRHLGALTNLHFIDFVFLCYSQKPL